MTCTSCSIASPQWVNGFVADLATPTRMVDEKGKVSAASEYGISGALEGERKISETAIRRACRA